MQIENQTNEVRIDTSKILRRSQTFMGLAILKFTTIIILIVVSIFILVDQNKSDNSGSKILIAMMAGAWGFITLILVISYVVNLKLIKATNNNSNCILMLVGIIISGIIAWIAFYKWYRAAKNNKFSNLNNGNVNQTSTNSFDSNNMPKY